MRLGFAALSVLALAFLSLSSVPAWAHGPPAFTAAGGGTPSWATNYGITDIGRATAERAMGPLGRPATNPGGTTPRPTVVGRTTPGARTKQNTTARYWFGAIKLEWEGTFLPRPSEKGYQAKELSFDDAVRGLGGDAAWKLKDRPTLIMVYDPAAKSDITVAGLVGENPEFVAASKYFNLLRVDRRSVKDEAMAKELARSGMRFLVYRADGTPAGSVIDNGTGRKLLTAMKPVIAKDYDRDAAKAVSEMTTLLSRTSWVKETIDVYEKNTICKDCGTKDERVTTRLAKLHEALADLRSKERTLLVRGKKEVASR